MYGTELLQMSWPTKQEFVPNLSCDYFNQSCSAKGKIAPADILPNRAK